MVEGPSGGNGRGSAGIGEILAVGTRPAGSGRVTVERTAALGEPVLRWRSRAHSIAEIEKELARIWSEPNLETLVDGQPGRHIAARSNVMNLVVIARRPEIGERCAATIQRLTGLHPSRTIILLTADPDGPSWLEAQIQAHCVLPREDAAETCAETIYLTAGGESGRHLTAIVAPLLIHDLPVAVWWPDEPAFGGPMATEVLAMADRLVIDGAAWTGNGLQRLRQAAELLETSRMSVQDFALLRQSRWREAIASVFDMPDCLPYLRGLRRIAVTYATHDETGDPTSTNVVKPVYHVAWLASRLGLRVREPLTAVDGGFAATLAAGRGDVEVVVRPDVSPAPSGTTLRVELVTRRRGSELRADVTAEQDAVHVRVRVDGTETLDRFFPATRRTDIDLLAEAVEAVGRDPLTVGTLRMAGPLVGADATAAAASRRSGEPARTTRTRRR